jgi:hypothetical protein
MCVTCRLHVLLISNSDEILHACNTFNNEKKKKRRRRRRRRRKKKKKKKKKTPWR